MSLLQAMSSLTVSGHCSLNQQQEQQQQEQQQKQQQPDENNMDTDVEDTIVSPLVKGNSDAVGAFKNIPHEIFTKIMNELDPVSQVCFSLIGSHFRQSFREMTDYDRGKYIHGCSSNNNDKCCHARESLPLNLKVSKCGRYISDPDKGCFESSMPLNWWEADCKVEWRPTLADFLWEENFFWSSGAQWCHGCYRVLPPKSWDECTFEKDFWALVANPSGEPHMAIKSLLARALLGGIERRSTGLGTSTVGSSSTTHFEQILSLDNTTAYYSRQVDIDSSLCTKCRVKKIVTDNGRRREVVTGDLDSFHCTEKHADRVVIYLHDQIEIYWQKQYGNSHIPVAMLTPVHHSDKWKYSVMWDDVLRECGLFVKEYKKVELLCPRSQMSTRDMRTPLQLKLEWGHSTSDPSNPW